MGKLDILRRKMRKMNRKLDLANFGDEVNNVEGLGFLTCPV